MTQPPPISRAALTRRFSGRALVTDDTNRVLLLRGSDPDRPEQPDFWWTPGGGIDAGESPAQATKRELWEEVGLCNVELSDPILLRSCVFPLAGVWYEGVETFFWVKAPGGFEPMPQQWEELESQVIQEMCWLTVQDIRDLEVPAYPECLANLVEHVLSLGAPLTPWIENDERNG